MRKIVVFVFIFLFVISVSSITGKDKRTVKGVYFEVGTMLYHMQPMLWSAGISMDLTFKNRLYLSPELTLLGSGIETMATPIVMINYKSANMFLGVGFGAMLPFSTQDSDTESTFPVFKINVGFFIGKVKVMIYLLRGSGSDYSEELSQVFGISLGFRLKKKKK